MHEALFYTPENKGLRCSLCSHHCLIAAGGRGLCKVRQNQGGKLYSLVYGMVAAEAADPVEKKPLYHFLPGSRTWSIATQGCNFSCRHCQNYSLSQVARGGQPVGRMRSAQEVVAMAQEAGCESISYTYSEPTIFFEFAEDCALAAKEQGLANIFVSNGYMSGQAAERAAAGGGKWLDAANIDIKAFSEKFYREICGAKLAPVLETIERLHSLGVWLEITTLIIPGLNDRQQELRGLAKFIAAISPDIPWHLSAFHPAYKLTDAPCTPVDSLLQAREIGLSTGLHYVYLGNVQLPGASDTICPDCGEVLAVRSGLSGKQSRLVSKCSSCGRAIAGRFAA